MDEDYCVRYGAVGDTIPYKHEFLNTGLPVFEAPQSGDCPENRFGVFFRMFDSHGCDTYDRYGLTRWVLG